MRCLYCGIKLKIGEKAKVIRHCPECSVKVEYGGRVYLQREEDKNRSLRAGDVRRLAASASMKRA